MKVLKSALTGLVFVSAVFAMVETGLRVLRPRELQYYRDLKVLHAYHPDTMVTLAPDVDLYIRHHAGLWEGKFTTNSLGFRASPEPGGPEPLMACLGDSMVMGFGVSDEDTFCKQLDGIVLGGKRYRTANLAVDNFGSMGAAKRLDDSLSRLKLSAVLFFVSPNDYTMPKGLRDRGVLPDDDTDALREKNPALTKFFRVQFELTRASYTLMSMKLALEQLQLKWTDTLNSIRREMRESGIATCDDGVRRGGIGPYLRRSFYGTGGQSDLCDIPGAGVIVGQARAPRVQNKAVTFGKSSSMCPTPIPDRFRCEERAPPDSELEPLSEFTRRAYDRMIASTRAAGVKFVFVLPAIQDNDLYCASHGLYSPLYSYALRAKAYVSRKGIPVIETLRYTNEICGEPVPQPGEITRPSRTDDYFIPGDGHYTALGNRWLAKVLVRELAKLKEINAL